jgi:hypothetical protein
MIKTFLVAGFAVVTLAGCSGPRFMNTDSANFSAINYGKYTGANGDQWELAGGKDGTGVSLEIVKGADGSTMVKWTAENYDATTVLAKMNERLAAERDAALRAADLLITP